MKKISGTFPAAVFLILWALVILKTWGLGDLPRLVTPKFIPFILSSAVISLAAAAVMIFKNKKYKLELSAFKIVILAIPVVIACGIRPVSVSMPLDKTSPGINDKKSPLNDDDGVPEIALQARASDTIRLNDENYFIIVSDIYNNLKLYDGKTIELTGMIVRKKNPKDASDCAVMRMMMLCCAADLQAVGFVCRYEKASTLISQSWHTVKGRIHLEPGEGDIIPCLILEEVIPAEKPANEYIYPI